MRPGLLLSILFLIPALGSDAAASASLPMPISDTAASAVSGPRPQAGWPLSGRPVVVHGFAPPPQPWLAGHRGVDLRSSSGAVVRAPITGRVEVARTIVDRGVLVLRSGSIQVSLEPVSAVVLVGDFVQAGDPIGVVADGRSHCAPQHCLHWGLRVAGEYRDPLLLVRRYRAVLLPVD